MSSLSTEWARIVQICLGNPGSVVLGIVLGILGVAAAGLIVRFVGEVFGCKVVSSGRTVLVLLLTAVALLGAAVLTAALVCPKISHAAVARWLPAVAAAVALLAVVLPLTRLILKAGYFQALFTVGLSLMAAAVVVALVNAGARMAKAGSGSLEGSANRLLERERIKDGIR